MSALQFTFEITVPRVPGVTAREMADFIKTAVACWGGGMNPEHPLGPPCPLGKRGAVKVSRVSRSVVAEGFRRLIADYESQIHSEYDGTSLLDGELAKINYAREILKVLESQL